LRAWVSNEHVNNHRTGSFLKTQNTKRGTNLDVRESKQGGIKCNQKQNTKPIDQNFKSTKTTPQTARLIPLSAHAIIINTQ